MKQIFTLLAAAVVVSCGSECNEGIVKGAVIDASMNNVVIVTAANDTLGFSTMALVDSGKMVGIMLGDSIEVAYGPLEGNEQVDYYNATSVKLLYRSSESYLVGQWVEPNPIDSTSVQGFVLSDDNKASSINMATLTCSQWSYNDGKLTLTLTSKGNKVENTSDEVYDIIKLDGDSLLLSQNGSIVWRLGHAR